MKASAGDRKIRLRFIVAIATAIVVLLFTSWGLNQLGGSQRLSKDMLFNFDVQMMLRRITMYERTTGPLFAVYENGETWWRKLLQISPEAADELFNAPPTESGSPTDPFGNTLVFIPPRTLRAVGPNGIDDGGTLDDWTFTALSSTALPSVQRLPTTEPNWGLWYSSQYAAVQRRAYIAIPSALILFGACIALLWRRSRTFGALFGFILLGVTLNLIRPNNVRILHWPSWLNTLELAGVAISLIGALGVVCMAAVIVARAIENMALTWRIHRHPGMCQNCGYDLISLTTNQCPECGESFDMISKHITTKERGA